MRVLGFRKRVVAGKKIDLSCRIPEIVALSSPRPAPIDKGPSWSESSRLFVRVIRTKNLCGHTSNDKSPAKGQYALVRVSEVGYLSRTLSAPNDCEHIEYDNEFCFRFVSGPTASSRSETRRTSYASTCSTLSSASTPQSSSPTSVTSPSLARSSVSVCSERSDVLRSGTEALISSEGRSVLSIELRMQLRQHANLRSDPMLGIVQIDTSRIEPNRLYRGWYNLELFSSAEMKTSSAKSKGDVKLEIFWLDYRRSCDERQQLEAVVLDNMREVSAQSCSLQKSLDEAHAEILLLKGDLQSADLEAKALRAENMELLLKVTQLQHYVEKSRRIDSPTFRYSPERDNSEDDQLQRSPSLNRDRSPLKEKSPSLCANSPSFCASSPSKPFHERVPSQSRLSPSRLSPSQRWQSNQESSTEGDHHDPLPPDVRWVRSPGKRFPIHSLTPLVIDDSPEHHLRMDFPRTRPGTPRLEITDIDVTRKVSMESKPPLPQCGSGLWPW
eukprot:CAMPEP_0184666008 /NCGR_PEP_ID=MMETSP0308-20130426/59631_1 /TAXON_ID=38269 /ORGANISM="Gloeochaete witrockiana, Strain SAG 46.84" /LENGTH=498 /DNA_ID=CAMNT_0027110359 /DNA_START=205 /DNA_END=1698 /DNA_ORIENTATION=-